MPFIIRGERDTTREKREREMAQGQTKRETQILITICFLMTLVASEKKLDFKRATMFTLCYKHQILPFWF